MNKLTHKEIKKLPGLSRKRMASVFRLTDSVFVDNEQGVGATKEHTQIKDKGFATLMPVEEALALFNGTPVAEEKVLQIKNSIVEGYGVASPRVFLDVEPYMSLSKKRCAITGAEGLEIVRALQECGVEKVPVQIYMLGYAMRHVEDKSDLLNQISYGVVDAEGTLVRSLVNSTTV